MKIFIGKGIPDREALPILANAKRHALFAFHHSELE
jgi:hypothetical protein